MAGNEQHSGGGQGGGGGGTQGINPNDMNVIQRSVEKLRSVDPQLADELGQVRSRFQQTSGAGIGS